MEHLTGVARGICAIRKSCHIDVHNGTMEGRSRSVVSRVLGVGVRGIIEWKYGGSIERKNFNLASI